MRDRFTTRSDPPLPEEYSRITNPERLRPLHSRAERLLERLQRDYDVTRREMFDMLPGMTPFDHDRAPISLVPVAPTAAPIGVAFTALPSLILRYGRWLAEPFPVCACDACAATAEEEWERFEAMVWNVVHGTLTEELSIRMVRAPLLSWSLGTGSGWSRLPRAHGKALALRGSGRIRWHPWPERRAAGPTPFAADDGR